MTLITNETLNNATNNYNIFILLKKNMVNGELKIHNLSSKNRSLLHRVCANYNLEHYSTGNYSDRIIVIKDTNHSYFNESYDFTKSKLYSSNNVETYKKEEKNYDYEEDYEEEDYEEDYEEEVEEEVEEEADTDTYSSSSESSSGSVQSNNNLIYSELIKEFTSIKLLSKINLVLNIFIIYNISLQS